MRTLALGITITVIGMLKLTTVSAQDKIEVRQEHHVGHVTLPCTILNFTQKEIKVKLLPSGNIRTYPSSQIVKVHIPQTEQYQTGLKQLQSGQFDKATQAFNAALNIENRTWVRREILALMIKTALRQGDDLKAALRFQMMVENEPRARYFDLIPLDWSINETLSPTRSAARSWVTDKNEVKQLIGASFLLNSREYQSQAEAVLRSLATSTQLNIQQLARAQLWRVRLKADDLSLLDLQRWERNLHQIPEHLKAGPYFLLGVGYAMLERHDQAAASFLWIPLAYDSNPQLSSIAYIKAADSLLAMGQTQNAIRLYQETVARYPQSSSRQIAQQMIDQLLKPDGLKK